MKIVLTLVIAAAVAGIAGLAVLFSGVYNVAANVPHTGLTHKVLGIFIDRSVAFHARDIVAPRLDQPEQAPAGARRYAALCAECHGGPGADRDEFSYGLYPAPPDLREPAAEFSPAELFWITRNGLKMSGMPSFFSTHEDGELWSIVAFVRRLPGMTPAEYAELTRAAGGEGATQGEEAAGAEMGQAGTGEAMDG